MRLLLTGGGTAGHIAPNIAIIKALRKKEKSPQILYMGSYSGMEKKMITDLGIDYTPVITGKLRRYFDFQNFIDLILLPFGIVQAVFKILFYRPDMIFSKGGYVSVPVVIAGGILRKKIILHESDSSPGLANKICIYFASKILVPSKSTIKFLPKSKQALAEVCGSPIREELFLGSQEKGYEFSGLNNKKPIILVMGGSLGAQALNDTIYDNLDKLLKKVQIIHICGKGKIKEELKNKKGYFLSEFIKTELKDLYKITDLIVSRAGANAISEFQALNIPSILIPLPKDASRGDQIENALLSKNKGASIVLFQKDLSFETLSTTLDNCFNSNQLETMKKSMKDKNINPLNKIIKLITLQ